MPDWMLEQAGHDANWLWAALGWVSCRLKTLYGGLPNLPDRPA
jgi:hypothetical protein